MCQVDFRRLACKAQANTVEVQSENKGGSCFLVIQYVNLAHAQLHQERCVADTSDLACKTQL
jgi:hypothetical protein